MSKLKLINIFVIIALSFSCLIPATLFSAEQKKSGDECLKQLEDQTIERIGCTVFFAIDSEQQKALQELTAGVLLNAECKVAVSMERKVIFEALLKSTHLESLQQPTACEISTSGEPLRTNFTLAPSVEFKDGRAVAAKPGLANIEGLPPVLGRLLEDWVNSSEEIEAALVSNVNQYIDSEHNATQ